MMRTGGSLKRSCRCSWRQYKKKTTPAALALLKHGNQVTAEQHLGMNFEEFSQWRFGADTYDIQFEGIDRRAHVFLFSGKKDGVSKAYTIYVVRKDDRWRIAI